MSALLATWTVKLANFKWLGRNEMSLTDVWLLIEVIFFFSQAMAGMVFLFQIFYIPAHKFTTNAMNLLLDKNPYNDQDTEDMLRHFKLEYFLMTGTSTFIITELVFILGYYDLKYRGPITTDCIMILGACMVPRILKYIYYSISLVKGNTWFEKHLCWLNYFISVISYVVAIFCWISLYRVDRSNIVIMVWLKLEAVALFIEPSSLLVLAFFKRKENREVEIPNRETGEIEFKTLIPSTYGSFVASEADHADVHDYKLEYAEKQLKKFNQKLFFMKEDFVMVVCMAYYRRNAKRFAITAAKRSQLFFSCIFSQMITCGMLCCMLYAVLMDEGGNYSGTPTAQNWPLFGCKFLSAIALHFMLYPEVADGMQLMKFSIYSFDQFVSPESSLIVFGIAFF